MQVNMGFRSHINQTSEMVRRLNDAMRSNQMEATNLIEGKRQLLKIVVTDCRKHSEKEFALAVDS